MNYRNRDLLRLSYSLPCTLRIPGVCQGGRGEPAHSNQARHGKGAGMKAHDVFYAASCRACHREIDQGSTLTKQERRDIWQAGFERTLLALWDTGQVQVTHRGLEVVAPEGRVVYNDGSYLEGPRPARFVRRRKSRCTAAANQAKRPAGGFAR